MNVTTASVLDFAPVIEHNPRQFMYIVRVLVSGSFKDSAVQISMSTSSVFDEASFSVQDASREQRLWWDCEGGERIHVLPYLTRTESSKGPVSRYGHFLDPGCASEKFHIERLYTNQETR